MKPAGPMPPGFDGADGQLSVGGIAVEELARAAGDTPFFAYDLGMIRARIDRLRRALPAAVAVHYALKANPFPPLVRALAGLTGGIDVASEGELQLALAAGAAPDRISFAGPGKRDRELEAALRAGATLNLESEGEAERALVIGERLGLAPALAVRVNPDFELRGSGMKMGGGAKPFGVDAERVPALIRRLAEAGANYRGLHIFAGSQALDASAVIEAQASAVVLAARLSEQAGIAPPLVNLGGGFGIPYFAGDLPLDIEAVGAALDDALATRDAVLAQSGFALELGRWLVGEAGVYVTRIVDRKQSHGQTFLVVDGGLHHQLAASGNFGAVVRRNYPVAIAGRFDAPADEVASIVGCLCTPLDRLADQVALPRAEIGDLVAVFLAGAYGASASPSAFLGHAPAPELLINDGAIIP